MFSATHWKRGHSEHARSGQVLLITLLALSVLVALIFYVYNLGVIVNRRMVVQHSADSVAVSGAGWMARSMNVIAMNNCGQSRMIALVPVLDSMPLAVEMSLHDTIAWEQRLNEQLALGISEPGQAGVMLRDGLESLHGRIELQRDILRPVDEVFNRGMFDMPTVTHWSRGLPGGGPDGALWQAAITLDDLSRATVQSAGYLSQANATSFGQANGVQTSFLVPVIPQIPAIRGQFDHFKPVMQARLAVTGTGMDLHDDEGDGGAIPNADFWHRLGPWARLFRWRDYFSTPSAWEWVPPSPGRGQDRGGGGSIGLGGRTNGTSARDRNVGGGWRVTERVVQGYRTYGPFSWALRRIDSYASHELPDTFFARYMNRLARIKLNYMFDSTNTTTVVNPEWIIDYNQARALADQSSVVVHQTMFYIVEIVSSVPEGSANWLVPGTYRTNSPEPLAIWTDEWTDPSQWPIPKIGDHIWKDSWTYETTEDWDLGIYAQREDPADPDSPPQWNTVYVVQWYIWGGINIGQEIEVSNPANWDDASELPAPYLLDTRIGDYRAVDPDSDQGVRRSHFTFLGIAKDSPHTDVWGSRFSPINPSKSMTSAAQAKLFNPTSWDLWTQNWQVQLTPVTMWDDWVERLADGADQAGQIPELVDINDVTDSQEYFHRLLNVLENHTNH